MHHMQDESTIQTARTKTDIDSYARHYLVQEIHASYAFTLVQSRVIWQTLGREMWKTCSHSLREFHVFWTNSIQRNVQGIIFWEKPLNADGAALIRLWHISCVWNAWNRCLYYTHRMKTRQVLNRTLNKPRFSKVQGYIAMHQVAKGNMHSDRSIRARNMPMWPTLEMRVIEGNNNMHIG